MFERKVNRRLNRLYTFADMLAELSRRECAANIKPDPNIDTFMKVSHYK